MVKINLDYYKEQDKYCYYVLNNLDTAIIQLLKTKKNDELIKEKAPQLYYYLLDNNNKGLLEWIDGLSGNILEISGGLGVNTELLCNRAESVTTISFSKVNAEIIASRLSDFDNLEIIVGNILDIKPDKKFDYIILTDILEFSRVFFKTEHLFIEHLKNMLTKNGKIICAISNKYGIGNFSGCVSHITGKAFDEINNYPEIPVLTGYTKLQLKNIFETAGLKPNFYYPLPNHYQNEVILSDKSLNKLRLGNKIPTLFKYYGMNPNRLIDEFQAVKDAIFDNRFTSVVNSYIIIAEAVEKNSLRPHYAQFNNGIMTTLDNKSCTKTALNAEGESILDKMYEFYQTETKRLKELEITNIKYAQSKKQKNSLIMEHAKGKCLNQIGLELLHNYNKFLAFGLEYKSLINKIYPNQIYQDFKIADIILKNVACAENVNIDLNMSNIFKDGNNYTITDYDKTAPIIPVNYIVAQGIFVFAIDSGFSFNEVEYLKQLGLSEREIKCYQYIYTKQNISFFSEQ